MNDEIKYVTGVASDFSPKIIAQFKEIVLEAGQVKESSFDGLRRKNPTLMFIPDADEMSAVGALKIPNDNRKNNYFRNANTSEIPGDYKFELGWIVSNIRGKGYAKKIVEVLLETPDNIYATVKENNVTMKHILEKYEFQKSGQPFKSDNGDYLIELYILKNKN